MPVSTLVQSGCEEQLVDWFVVVSSFPSNPVLKSSTILSYHSDTSIETLIIFKLSLIVHAQQCHIYIAVIHCTRLTLIS